jgi:hypothetical protein
MELNREVLTPKSLCLFFIIRFQKCQQDKYSFLENISPLAENIETALRINFLPATAFISWKNIIPCKTTKLSVSLFAVGRSR